jgi:CheY-like chemotaxis protein
MYICYDIAHMKKVIVAKDIRAVLAKERSFLNRTGIRTFTAASNEKALALHRAVKADLIIARLNNSEMSGETLCSLIRNDDELRNVSLIIVSSDTEADLERCVQCRANAFISSPIDSEVLLQEAYRLLHVAPRTSCRVPVRVKLYGKIKERPFTGYTKNISTSGMLLGTAAELFEGDYLMCSFDLPGPGHITANAEIVRVVGKEAGHDAIRYGIRFTNPGTDLVSALNSFVEKKCSQP